MSGYEVPNPILNSPFDEPKEYWYIVEGRQAERRAGRRPAMYFYRDPKAKPDSTRVRESAIAIELKLVNRIRQQVKAWREQGYPGATRTTADLLQWWQREGRETRLFFAQLEAAETIIFLPRRGPTFCKASRFHVRRLDRRRRRKAPPAFCATPAKWPRDRARRP